MDDIGILTHEVDDNVLHAKLSDAEARFAAEKADVAEQAKERKQVVDARLRQLERESTSLDNLQARL